VVRYLVVALVVAIAFLIGWLAQRRRPDAPVRTGWTVPEQLDRTDFARPDAPFLVAVFTSATCTTCADVMAKVAVLESSAVAVHEAEYGRDRALHTRYSIDAVPVVLIADDHGVVQRSFLGPTSVAHLWAAVAEVREPGSAPPACEPG
jgi:hypothetical protein